MENESIKKVPVSPERIITVLVSYIAAYLFIRGTDGEYAWESLVIFALVVASVELLNRNRPRQAESYVWLACFAMNAVSFCFMLDDVWDSFNTALFTIVFGVWWILSRSDKLMEGKSGHLLPADAWTGFAFMPFRNFLLRIRTIIAVPGARRSEEKKQTAARTGWIISAVIACLILFMIAVRLLMEADETFDHMLRRFCDFLYLSFEFDEDVMVMFLFSLPLGCLGCGLILGCADEDRSGIEKRKDRLYAGLEAMRRVPEWLWIAVICLFSVLYVVFFVLQGGYLFGAFAGKLPEGFIVAEYARQGFFELCKVMVVNSVLLWLATRMVSAEIRHENGFRAACLVLLSESVLFSVIAFSKLALYISIYGFTPLRLQSTWLVCVLFAACVLWGYTIITGKPVFRKWMIFGAVTLSILSLI